MFVLKTLFETFLSLPLSPLSWKRKWISIFIKASYIKSFAWNHSRVIKNGGLPLVELEENSLPENFVAHEDSSIKLVIKPGQIAELALTRPPPGPWYIVGYLKGFDMAIKQKVLAYL